MEKVSDFDALRATISHAALSAGIALSFAAVAQDAAAQQAPPKNPDGSQSIELETINVEGNGDGESGATTPNTLKATTGLARLPGSVQDTPQVINVVTKETLEQQNVTTLDQALRNVPGVTSAIGEGQGGFNGDQFRIRGFEAKGDIYVDGLRDFGVYVRDSFNYEEVQVLKGPSSESFGMGTTGGAINTASKIPHLDDWYRAEGTIGGGPLARATLDVNKQVSDTTAVRLNAMFNDQDTLDRDHVENDRWGVAGSVGFGLGTDTTWTLNLFHQHNDRTPDYGVPIVAPSAVFAGGVPNGTHAKPVTEFGVDRSTFYGTETDHDISDVSMLTSRFNKEVNDWLTVSNDTRLAYYERDFATSVPECGYDSATTAYSGTCSANFFAGLDPRISFGGGNPGYLQETWGAQNITTALAEFHTGFLRHEAVVGLDLFFQRDQRMTLATRAGPGSASGNPKQPAVGPGSTIENPIFENITGYFLEAAPLDNNGQREGEAKSVALFASDRIWLTDQFSLLGGVRWDNYTSQYRAWCNVNNNPDTAGAPTAACPEDDTFSPWFKETTSIASPKASAIWEPTNLQTYYLSWARSFSPPGQFISNSLNPINSAQPDLEPEENEIFEVGGKIGLLDGRLGLSAAAFRIDKSNATFTDPVTGDTVLTGEEQRVEGFEVGLTGNVTEAWVVQAAFTHLESEVLESTTPSNIGNSVAYAPENAFSLWTTYDLAVDVLPQVPGVLLIGGGVNYTDEYFTNSNNIALIPDAITFDALISYEIDNWRVALNGYNLTDELNYSSAFGNRAIPSSGRAVTLTVGARF